MRLPELSEEEIGQDLGARGEIRQDGRIKAILIDVNEELTPIQLSMKLADAMGAQYFKLEDLRAHGILEVIESQRTLAE